MFIRTIGMPVALDTNWNLLPLNGGGDTPPRRYNLTNLMVWLTDIAGAGSVTIQVTHDNDRAQTLVPSTPSGATQAISPSNDPAKGGISINLGAFWASEDGEPPKVWAKLDAGTATGTARLTGTTEGNP